MDFSLSDDRKSLKELAARIFADAVTDQSLKAFEAGGAAFDAGLWQTLAEAGLLGLAIPEAQGGLGLGLIDLGLLLEEAGRALAPVPLHAALVLGALPLAAFGNEAQKALLADVATGQRVLTAALEEAGNHDFTRPLTHAARSGSDSNGGWVLNGVKTAVPYGAEASHILVPAATDEGGDDGGVAVFLLDPKTPGVTLESQRGAGAEPQARLSLENVQLDDGDLLGAPAQGGQILRWLVERARAMLAAYQVGLCEEALARTAAYTAERVQFGRPIGSMQAVQHRVADGFIDLEAMRSTAMRAAWLLDQNRDAAAEIATAKYWAAIGGHRISHSAQHLHGGLGADMDYPIHRFFLAAKQVELSLGGTQPLLAEIGRQIAAGATQPLSGVGA